MATVPSKIARDPDSAALATLHAVYRFATGTTAAFILCEALGWFPTFLAPLLTGVLLVNLPAALPPKGGAVLVLIQAGAAYSAFILASLLNDTPMLLFGAIGLILFISFATLARGRGFLPILFLLIAYSTIPVVTMVAPAQAGALPLAFSRSMMVAVATVWAVQAIWPVTEKASAPPTMPGFTSPLALAITGVVIVLPLMLLYLMYAITDALPILITTIMLVINFDPKRSAGQGAAMMVGNFIGGLVALLAFHILQIAPSLFTLALIAFLVSSLFAPWVLRGGPAGAIGLTIFNQWMVIFGLALSDGSEGGLWATRLFQFAIACIFAIGMMSLLFPALERRGIERIVQPRAGYDDVQTKEAPHPER